MKIHWMTRRRIRKLFKQGFTKEELTIMYGTQILRDTSLFNPYKVKS